MVFFNVRQKLYGHVEPFQDKNLEYFSSNVIC